MKFDKVDDDTLIDMIAQGVALAMDELIRRYKYYSWKLAYQFYNEHPNSGIAIEDFHQVCFATLIPALKTYHTANYTFYSYWKSCASNDMCRYYGENSYTAKGWTFAGISLDEETPEDDFCVAEKHGRVDEGIHSGILKEELQLMYDEVIAKFKKEIDVIIINLFIEGRSFEQIEGETNCPIRHIYYVIDRFQKLFSNLLKKRNYN